MLKISNSSCAFGGYQFVRTRHASEVLIPRRSERCEIMSEEFEVFDSLAAGYCFSEVASGFSKMWLAPIWSSGISMPDGIRFSR